MNNFTNKIDIITHMNFDPSNPNNIRLYHGTSHRGIKYILQEGFLYSGQSIWNCSDEDYSYFYELKRFIKAESLEEDSFKYQQYAAIQRANESAQLQEAMLERPSFHTYVIELVVPPEFAIFIEDDTSCENMYRYGAVQILHDHINTLIRTGEYAMHIYKGNFSPKCSLLYVTGLIENEYFCGEFTSYEESIVKTLRSSDVFIDDLLNPDIIYEQSFGLKPEFNIYNG